MYLNTSNAILITVIAIKLYFATFIIVNKIFKFNLCLINTNIS